MLKLYTVAFFFALLSFASLFVFSRDELDTPIYSTLARVVAAASFLVLLLAPLLYAPLVSTCFM